MELKEKMYVRYKRDITYFNYKQEPPEKIAKIIEQDGEFLKIDVQKQIIFVSDVIKASDNIIDLIKDGDIVVIEYYVPRYRQRITRMFECSLLQCKDENDVLVTFENSHCKWYYDKAKKEWIQAKGYNPKIKSIITKEQFERKSYKINEENN